MSNKVTSQVTVDLSVRLSIDDAWREETTIAQVQKQAKKAAEEVIRVGLAGRAKILDYNAVNIFSETKP